MIITIDGPVASGKSSIAKALAKELKIYYLYTGLLYRSVAFVLWQRFQNEGGSNRSAETDGANNDFSVFVASLTADDLSFIAKLCYDYGAEGDGESRPYLFYQGPNDAAAKEITEHLYHTSMGQRASVVSANKLVRDSLLDVQRNVAKKYDIVADGRDCGTVVFPNADYKFYLTADAMIRAQRLMLDETRGAFEKDIEKVKAGLEERDRRDKEREVAPLTIPEDAIIIDNSSLTQEKTLNKFLACISVK